MGKSTDIRSAGLRLYFLPVHTRVPLKFGTETLTEVTCARVALRVEDRQGRGAEGWGETPLNVQWVWPSSLPYALRHQALQDFCRELAAAWATFDNWGHPMEVGHAFLEHELPRLHAGWNARSGGDPMPWLAALVCCSLFDLALHDAYGQLHGISTWETYNATWMNHDLAAFLEPSASVAGHYPQDFLIHPRPDKLPVWHLVGGADWLEQEEADASAPQDGHPFALRDWIRRDGLNCLKIKLRGNDLAWDKIRMQRVGEMALQEGVEHLSADFNCTVRDPAYVEEALDWLAAEHPEVYRRLLYVEQPFPYELESHPIDVHAVAARKPLFMDESAHDWRVVRRGLELGWNGVALKTCKTLSGALLSLCWARRHGMQLMVQDLTNPMLAQIPHLQLAAHAGTIMGAESNAMQFYPKASLPEAAFHPGSYIRREGAIGLSSIGGPGLGYGAAISARALPEAASAL